MMQSDIDYHVARHGKCAKVEICGLDECPGTYLTLPQSTSCSGLDFNAARPLLPVFVCALVLDLTCWVPCSFGGR